MSVSLSLSSQGFVAAVAPFNFTAIGGNLAGTPALMVSDTMFGSGSSMANSVSESRPEGRSAQPPLVLLILPGFNANSCLPG